jgi:hypothetical protein
LLGNAIFEDTSSSSSSISWFFLLASEQEMRLVVDLPQSGYNAAVSAFLLDVPAIL